MDRKVFQVRCDSGDDGHARRGPRAQAAPAARSGSERAIESLTRFDDHRALEAARGALSAVDAEQRNGDVEGLNFGKKTPTVFCETTQMKVLECERYGARRPLPEASRTDVSVYRCARQLRCRARRVLRHQAERRSGGGCRGARPAGPDGPMGPAVRRGRRTCRCGRSRRAGWTCGSGGRGWSGRAGWSSGPGGPAGAAGAWVRRDRRVRRVPPGAGGAPGAPGLPGAAGSGWARGSGGWRSADTSWLRWTATRSLTRQRIDAQPRCSRRVPGGQGAGRRRVRARHARPTVGDADAVQSGPSSTRTAVLAGASRCATTPAPSVRRSDPRLGRLRRPIVSSVASLSRAVERPRGFLFHLLPSACPSS